MGFYLGSILLTALAFISLPSHAQTATYEFCANENQMCNFSGTRTVRYGANNSFVTRTLSNGVHCSNGTFGDPIFGVVKRCELLSTSSTPPPTEPPPPSSSEYTFCANENQMCNFTGTRTVRYGANNSFVTLTLSNGVHCSNGTFGDPIVGVVKRCELLASTSTPPPTQPPPPPPPTEPPPSSSEYTFCANENQMCNFSGTRTVRYGANNSFVTRTLSNGVHCSNGTFGDPIVGVVKRCELLASTSTPPPTEPPPSEPPPPTEPPPATTPGLQARTYARVLTSGHSLVDGNFSDNILDIANKRGDNYNFNKQIVVGSPIRIRTLGDGNPPAWNGYSRGTNRNSQGLNMINELRSPMTLGAGERYDTLLITERHDILSVIQWENTVGYLRHYHDRLIEGNSNAQTLFYQSWLSINKSSPALWIDYEKKALVAWECAASKVNLSLQSENRNDRVKVLPTGAALVDLVEKAIAGQVSGITGTTQQRLNMIFSDDVHLTQLGNYYASLVSYSVIMGKSPAGVTPPSGSGISQSTATALQTIAWDYIQNYYSRTNPGTRSMAECRTFIPEQICEPYNTILNRPNEVTGCRNTFGNSNSQPIFRWPDPNFTPLPAP